MGQLKNTVTESEIGPGLTRQAIGGGTTEPQLPLYVAGVNR